MNSLIGRNTFDRPPDSTYLIRPSSNASTCLKIDDVRRALLMDCNQYQRPDGKIGDPWNLTTNIAGFGAVEQADGYGFLSFVGFSVNVLPFSYTNYVNWAFTRSSTSDNSWRMEMNININGFNQNADPDTNKPDPKVNIITFCVTPGKNTITSDGIHAMDTILSPCVYTSNEQDFTMDAYYDGPYVVPGGSGTHF